MIDRQTHSRGFELQGDETVSVLFQLNSTYRLCAFHVGNGSQSDVGINGRFSVGIVAANLLFLHEALSLLNQGS